MSETIPMMMSNEEYKKLRFSFSRALDKLKAWKQVTRDGFWNTCFIKMKDYSFWSDSTIPYIQMVKWENYFPTDLSCESIFADDRYEV